MSEPFSPSSVARQLDYCSYCPKMCRHSCPVSNADGKETHTPQSKMDALNALRKGEVPWTSENTEALWACTGCRLCTTFCEHENEPGLVLMAGRAQANAHGAGHKNLANYPERFRNREARLASRLREHAADAEPYTEGVIGYWPGCDAVDKGMRDVDVALDLFNRLGGEIKLITSDQVCGGYPLLAAGYPDVFRWHAEKVAKSLRGFKKVVTNCSACLFTMQQQYAAAGVTLDTEVINVSQYLAEAVQKLPREIDKKPVYYHDPCYLARYSGIIEEPRMVLAQFGELREFEWSRGETECCGGGGLLPKTDPDTADTMARRRLREVANRGGGTVVTSCATCTYMLRSNAPSGVSVVDLATYVSDACRKLFPFAPKPEKV